MAKMIPSVLSPEIKSNAERRIFEWFRDDPLTSGWVVFHSLGISNHRRVLYGETDFFVLAPSLGIFAIEVKGGRVKREDGIWCFTDRYGNISTKNRGPFEQAWDSVHSIMDDIKKKLDNNHRHLKNLFYWIGVMLPDINYESTGVDELPWQVYDSRNGNKVGEFIKRISANAIKKWETTYGRLIDKTQLPSRGDVEYLTSIIKGNFDFALSVKARIRFTEEYIINLTHEQSRCLEQLDDNPRCVIQGSAGTGKTLLALEETKKSVARGERVALFCYNSHLGDWLKNYFTMLPKELQPIYVGTFHRFMIKEINNATEPLNPPDNDDEERFYSEIVPLTAYRVFQNKEPILDKIIVDEMQDLINIPYLDVIDICLYKGLARGKWIMFGDFSMQAIFSNDNAVDGMYSYLDERTAYIKYKLNINCRNSKPICEEIQTITGYTPLSGTWTTIEGLPVQYITFSDLDEQLVKLTNLLSLLKSENVPDRDITILSPIRYEASVVSLLKRFNIKIFKIRNSDVIEFSTIQAYKGLENSVIILTDIDTFRYEKLMYVALSRARSLLYVIESESASREYLELQRRRFLT